MVKEETIKKVTAALKAQLLPVDGLREIAVRRSSIEVKMDELLAVLDEKDFIVNAYQRLLGRYPEPEGIENWLRHLSGGKLTRVAFLKQLVESEEGQARRVFVPGLLHSHGPHSEVAGPFWKRSRQPSSGASSENFDRAVKEIEGQVQELAQQCLQVIEHIEHRLSKHHPVQKPTSKMVPRSDDQSIELDLDDGQEIDSKLNLLYDRIRSQMSQTVSEPLLQAVQAVRDLAALRTAEGTTAKWIIAGHDVMELVFTCLSSNIAILGCATSAEFRGMTESLAIQPIALPGQERLPHFADMANVVWVKDFLASQSDRELLQSARDLSRLLLNDGLLIVDESQITYFVSTKIKIALDLYGFKQVLNKIPSPPTDAHWTRLSQPLVFIKPSTAEATL